MAHCRRRTVCFRHIYDFNTIIRDNKILCILLHCRVRICLSGRRWHAGGSLASEFVGAMWKQPLIRLRTRHKFSFTTPTISISHSLSLGVRIKQCEVNKFMIVVKNKKQQLNHFHISFNIRARSLVPDRPAQPNK